SSVRGPAGHEQIPPDVRRLAEDPCSRARCRATAWQTSSSRCSTPTMSAPSFGFSPRRRGGCTAAACPPTASPPSPPPPPPPCRPAPLPPGPYLAEAGRGAVRVERVKRAPDKGHGRVDEVRSPVVFWERSQLDEDGALVSGQRWAELDVTPQTGRRDAAPDR